MKSNLNCINIEPWELSHGLNALNRIEFNSKLNWEKNEFIDWICSDLIGMVFFICSIGVTSAFYFILGLFYFTFISIWINIFGWFFATFISVLLNIWGLILYYFHFSIGRRLGLILFLSVSLVSLIALVVIVATGQLNPSVHFESKTTV